MKSTTNLLSFALKCALLAFALFLSGSLRAQWQAFTPDIPDTVGTSELRIAAGDNNSAWAITNKYEVDSIYYTGLYESIYYLRTADGGNTWLGGTIPMGSVPFCNNVSPISSTSAWVSGLDYDTYASYVLHTEDGGATWTRQLEDGFLAATSYIDFVHFWDDQNGIAVGDPAISDTDTVPFFEIYKTADGGANWTRVSSANIPADLGEYGIGGVYEIFGDHIWFGAVNAADFSGSRMFHSPDRGATWTAVSTPGVYAISFADSLHGVAYDYDSFRPRYTADGGYTWMDLPDTEESYLVSELVMIPESQILLSVQRVSNVGPFRTVISKDLGQTWEEIGTGEHAGNVAFASPTIGYGGEWQPLDHKNRMYKYAGNPLVGLFSGLELDAQVTLSPNPASDILQVQIEVSKPAAFVLLLNDLQGRLIERKTLDQTAQGNATFDISRLPAGMYTLTVSSDKGRLTRTVSKQ
jgi:photosystem II stability/assembly factor-like uncharacterized protein